MYNSRVYPSTSEHIYRRKLHIRILVTDTIPFFVFSETDARFINSGVRPLCSLNRDLDGKEHHYLKTFDKLPIHLKPKVAVGIIACQSDNGTHSQLEGVSV